MENHGTKMPKILFTYTEVQTISPRRVAVATLYFLGVFVRSHIRTLPEVHKGEDGRDIRPDRARYGLI